ncbi:MAG TPA: hypothetical protein VNO30_35560 [Kofleriaceae bacterium]|nr:hypothetical protein [Kofleriaceae bacterium]
MKIAIAAGSILLALASRADAQPLSEDFALGLGIGGTVGSWSLTLGTFYFFGDDGGPGDVGVVAFGLGALGTVLAPSFGHWYAGKPFTRGLGVRLVGAVTVVTAFAVAVDEGLLDGEPHAADRTAIPPTLAITGAVLLLAGTLDDLATTPRRVRRWNHAHGFSIAPIAGPHAAGLALGGQF